MTRFENAFPPGYTPPEIPVKDAVVVIKGVVWPNTSDVDPRWQKPDSVFLNEDS